MRVPRFQSRRLFIAQTVAGASVTFGQHRVDADALKQLRSRVQGPVILPADSGYEMARRIFYWNPTSERRPVAVVRCSHVDDVRYAVEFARKQRLEIAVRGGGHSTLGWGTSDGLVIDLTGMKRVTIDAAARTARIEAGATGGEVMQAAGRFGLAPIVGQCPAVGASGVTLGGGLGWLSGLHGAACDNLLSASVITPDGLVRAVDRDRDPELLWGLQGAGANFGVTTSLDCRLHPVGTVMSGDVHYAAREARVVLRFFREFMDEAPDSFQATLNLTPGERGVYISYCHAGDVAEAERLVRRLRSAAAPLKDTSRRQEFAELAGRTTASAAGASFRCLATAYRDRLSEEVIDAAVERLSVAPPETVIGLSHYMHGAVCRVKPDATAFPLRQAGAVHIRVGLDWSEGAAEPRQTWAEEACRMLRPKVGERIYANYQSYAGKGSAEAVFGGNLSRLRALKKKYDPDNVLRRNSNVSPEKA